MQLNERDEFVDYVNDLLKVTREGIFSWGEVNPTTFVAVVRNASGTVQIILQRFERPEAASTGQGNATRRTTRRTHNLTVSSQTPGGMNVEVNGGEDPRIEEALNAIYDYAVQKVVEKRVAFLRSTLPK